VRQSEDTARNAQVSVVDTLQCVVIRLMSCQTRLDQGDKRSRHPQVRWSVFPPKRYRALVSYPLVRDLSNTSSLLHHIAPKAPSTPSNIIAFPHNTDTPPSCVPRFLVVVNLPRPALPVLDDSGSISQTSGAAAVVVGGSGASWQTYDIGVVRVGRVSRGMTGRVEDAARAVIGGFGGENTHVMEG
jgi:hypothetical protein